MHDEIKAGKEHDVQIVHNYQCATSRHRLQQIHSCHWNSATNSYLADDASQLWKVKGDKSKESDCLTAPTGLWWRLVLQNTIINMLIRYILLFTQWCKWVLPAESLCPWQIGDIVCMRGECLSVARMARGAEWQRRICLSDWPASCLNAYQSHDF